MDLIYQQIKNLSFHSLSWTPA